MNDTANSIPQTKPEIQISEGSDQNRENLIHYAEAEDHHPVERKPNPLFPFMGIGSFIYAFFYTFFLYKNTSGITYPFFAGGTCLFFFLYLRKSGITARKFSLFLVSSITLLGISTCMTDSEVLILFNKLGIFILFFYLILYSLYKDFSWDLSSCFFAVINIVCTSFTFIFRPFTDFSCYLKMKKEENEKPEGKLKYIFFGILIAIPLLSVILILLYEADAVFSEICDRIFFFDFNYGHLIQIGFLFLFAFFASYCIMSRISIHDLKGESGRKRNLEPVMGITFTGIISFVYLIFCYIQVVYLFGGFGTLPEKYTYSSYAREGFFQLVFVCLINLALVLTCLKHFRYHKILTGILTFISVCTYIMIASSAYRMLLYIQVYYLTFLRVFVLWALLVIFLLITGTIILIYRRNFPFTHYCLITVTVLYIIFSFSHPDYWIAFYNLNQCAPVSEDVSENENTEYTRTGSYSDYSYLSRLSMDAAPAIFKMAAQDECGYESDWWLEKYAGDIIKKSYDYNTSDLTKTWIDEGNCIPKNPSPRKWNLSRWTAYSCYTHYYKNHPDFADEIEWNIMQYTGY